ncbi:hypothetical protein F5X98DRAFT_368287 [Xylaria grammica]|nr:hypothetical protein F5X98DRAFT_368287 [Xylaria grammica]
MREFYIKSITWETEYNPDSDIPLYISHNDAAFQICYILQKLAASPFILKQHHEFHEILYSDDPDGKSREVAEHLGKPFEELMVRLYPNPLPKSKRLLHSYLYLPSFVLEATVVDSRIQLRFGAALSRQKFVRPGEYVGNETFKRHLSPLSSQLNEYSLRQVKVPAYTRRLVPSVVSVDSTIYFFKPWISGRVHGYHELLSCERLLAAYKVNPSLLHNVYICRLRGLIIDNDDDVLQHYHFDIKGDKEYWPGTRLVGPLLTYTENKGTLDDIAPWSDCANEDRVRWSGQIRESVQSLHKAGMVWGDAKPQNILIRKDGNARLIDFGGSYSRGWVGEDKRESVEGDIQG